MLHFSKFGHPQISCGEKYINKKIKKQSIYRTQIQLRRHLFQLQNIKKYEKIENIKKYKFPFLQREQKLFSIINEYFLEKKNIYIGEKELENGERKTDQYKSFGKKEIYVFQNDTIEIIYFNGNRYNNLRTVLNLISIINKDIIKRNNALLKILEHNSTINNKKYLISLQIAIYDEIEKRDFEKIKQDITKQQIFFKLNEEIDNLDFFSLISFFSLLNKIQQLQKKWEKNNNYIFCLFDDVENVVIKKLYKFIKDFMLNTRGKNANITINHTLKNINIEKLNMKSKYEKNKSEKKTETVEEVNKKISLHEIYIKILDTLYILKNRKTRYYNYIIFILLLLYKNVYKHKYQYNYVFSISLLKLINEVIHLKANYYVKEPYTNNCKQNVEASNPLYLFRLLPMYSGYFYLQKDNCTFNFANSFFEEMNFYGIDKKKENVNKLKNEAPREIEIDKEICSLQMETEHNHRIGLIQSVSERGDTTIKKESGNIFSNEDILILKKNEILQDLLKYNIILLSIVSKKIKYVENKITFIDIMELLSNINMITYINNQILSINKLIDENDIYLKNIFLIKNKKELYYFLLLKYVITNFKNLNFANIYVEKEKEKGNSEYKNKKKYFLGMLSYISNIRNILTTVEKPKNCNNICNIQFLTETVNNVSLKKEEEEEEQEQEQEQKIKKMIINKINKDICLLTNNIILCYFNNEQIVNSTEQHSQNEKFSKNHITISMSFILNDIYFQNNYQLREYIFMHFLKNQIKYISLSNFSLEEIYLEYVTLYNWLKIFKKEINEAVNTVSSSPSLSYKEILQMFMNQFKVTQFQQKEEESYVSNPKKEKNNFFKNDCENSCELELLYILNKLHYFFFLAKKMITNIHFLNQINYYFFLNFFLINKYIENYKDDSTTERFSYFVNQCISKIINILLVHKYFNIFSEDSISSLTMFLKYTVDTVDREIKEKIKIYILPFLENKQYDITFLKQLLKTENEPQTKDAYTKNYQNGKEEIYEQEKKREINKSETKEIILSIDLSETIQKNKKHTNNVIEKDSYLDENISVKSFENSYKSYQFYNQDSNIQEEIHVNLEKKKKEIKKICHSIEKHELLLMLEQHILEMDLIKKENSLLKKKLNYIFLNSENFINSYANYLMMNNSSFFFKNDFKEINKNETNNMRQITQVRQDSVEKDHVKTKIKIHVEKQNHQKKTEKAEDIMEERKSINMYLKHDKIKVMNDYFAQLKKYETENCQKINNVLINMYIYNPYVYIKHKNTEQMKKERKKKILFLPYETYKNIQMIVNRGNNIHNSSLFGRLQTSFHVFFCKIWSVLKTKTDK